MSYKSTARDRATVPGTLRRAVTGPYAGKYLSIIASVNDDASIFVRESVRIGAPYTIAVCTLPEFIEWCDITDEA